MRSIVLLFVVVVMSTMCCVAQQAASPKISTVALRVDPIMDRFEPTTSVAGIVVRVPEWRTDDTSAHCVMTATVTEAALRDTVSQSPYSAIVTLVEQTPSTNAVGVFERNVRIVLKLTNGKVRFVAERCADRSPLDLT